MTARRICILTAIGAVTGLVTGIFGGGGGMILVPLLTLQPELEEQAVFPASVCIIFPICVVSILLAQSGTALTWEQVLPYLAGSFLGGITAGLTGRKIPLLWLHRILGILILWGGIRSLWK